MKRNFILILAIVASLGRATIGADTQPATTSQRASSQPALSKEDGELKAAADKIMAQKWASKKEMYEALAKLIFPGMTIAQLKIVLPVGMGLPPPATTHASVITSTDGREIMIIPPDAAISSETHLTGAPRFSVGYRLDEFFNLIIVCRDPSRGVNTPLEDSKKVIDSSPRIVERSPTPTP